MHTFASVAVVDARGRILMQQRDEHAPVDPDRWGLPEGRLEPGEDFRTAAARELEEETGLVVPAEQLESLGVTRFFSPPRGAEDEFELFVVRLEVTDADVVCGEGRQMVFRDRDEIALLDLTRSTARSLPLLVGTRQHQFAGVILVDREGRILLQERDEHPRIDPDRWGLCGGHVDEGEEFEAAAYRELEEETGIRLGHGDLEPWGDFVVDHREAYGTWDRMQVFIAATDLTDTDIDCREGRRIVFVEPHEMSGLDLTSAAADIVPAFLISADHRRLSMKEIPR